MYRNCCLCSSRKNGDFSLHQVPADPEKSRQWLRSIRQKYPHFKMSEKYVICSRHFLPEYVTRGEKVRLVEHAVPTIFDFSENTKKTRKPLAERATVATVSIPSVNISSPNICNSAPKVLATGNASMPEQSVIPPLTAISKKNDGAERKKSLGISSLPILVKSVVGSESAEGKTVFEKYVKVVLPSFVSPEGNAGASESQPVVPYDVMERVLQILNKRKVEQKLPNTFKIQKLIPVSAMSVLPGSQATLSSLVESFKGMPALTVLPKKIPSVDEKQTSLITSVDDVVTVLPDRNKGCDEIPAVVPLCVQPDVRARALEILAKRKAVKYSPSISAIVNEESISQISLKRILSKEQRLQATLKNRSRQIKSMRQKMQRLVKKIDTLKKQKAEIEEKSCLRLSDSLPFDLEGLLTSISRRTKQKYSPEMRDFAIAFHKISPRAYSFVRKNFLDMLPSYATIRQWRIDMKSERGVPLKEIVPEKVVPAENSIEELAGERIVQEENAGAEIDSEQVVREEIIES